MHCLNCGWDNPAGLVVCEKCLQPLPVDAQEPQKPSQPTGRPTIAFRYQQNTADSVARDSVERKTIQHNASRNQIVEPTLQENKLVGTSQKKEQKNGWLWSIIALLGVFCLMLTIVCIYEKDEADYWLHKSQNIQNHLRDIAEVCPIVITDIQMGNQQYDGTMISDYGQKIYSRKTKYLCAQIAFKTVDISDSKTIELKYKLFTPSGILSTGDSSPKGYTTTGKIYVSSSTTKANIFGWGRDTSGNWGAGTYKFEIYYNDRCIGIKSFKIY